MTLNQYARRLEAQHVIDRAILSADSPQAIARATIKYVQALLPTQYASVIYFDQVTGEAVVGEAVMLATTLSDTQASHLLSTRAISDLGDLQGLQWRDEQLTYDLQAVRRPTLVEKTLIEQGIRTYLTIPLRSQAELIGTLNLGKRQVEPFSPQDLEIAHELADQLAIALKQSLLSQATRRQLNELTLLHAAAAACASALDEKTLITQITEIIGRALPGDHFGVILRDEQFDDLVIHPTYHGLSESQQAIIIPNNGAIIHTFTTKQPYRLNRPTLATPPSTLHPFTQSELCVPLIAGENAIGVINVGSFRLDAFTVQHEQLLTTIAGQLATAIIKIRLFVQTEQELERRRRIEATLQETQRELERRVAERTQELSLIFRANQALIATFDPDELLTKILQEINHLLQVTSCSIWLLQPKTNELLCQQITGPRSELIKGWRLAPGEGVAGWVIQNRQPVMLADASQDERHESRAGQQTGLDIRSMIAVPLILKGKPIGVLQVVDTTPNRFDAHDLALLEAMAVTAAIAIDNARLYEQARQDADTNSILLQEVNHRVKNNLSAIMGLLYAERRHAGVKDDPVYQSIMHDLINRVQGLATVHSILSASNWGPVSLYELAQRVIHSALQALPHHKRINVQVTASHLEVTPDQAHHLALIINEIVTNCIKYSVENRPSGQFRVLIEESTRPHIVVMEFADDGPGFPEDVLRLEQPRHNVGFHLIQNIVRRNLQGTIVLRNGTIDPLTQIVYSGAVITISFQLG
ncbi:MAG: GAF domain-containing protein [Anaerolineae bacterium]|nr:GAF domain-containing protein [Anaerolineae bacterium]